MYIIAWSPGIYESHLISFFMLHWKKFVCCWKEDKYKHKHKYKYKYKYKTNNNANSNWVVKSWKKFGCCWKEDKYFVVCQRSVTRFFPSKLSLNLIWEVTEMRQINSNDINVCWINTISQINPFTFWQSKSGGALNFSRIW